MGIEDRVYIDKKTSSLIFKCNGDRTFEISNLLPIVDNISIYNETYECMDCISLNDYAYGFYQTITTDQRSKDYVSRTFIKNFIEVIRDCSILSVNALRKKYEKPSIKDEYILISPLDSVYSIENFVYKVFVNVKDNNIESLTIVFIDCKVSTRMYTGPSFTLEEIKEFYKLFNKFVKMSFYKEFIKEQNFKRFGSQNKKFIDDLYIKTSFGNNSFDYLFKDEVCDIEIKEKGRDFITVNNMVFKGLRDDKKKFIFEHIDGRSSGYAELDLSAIRQIIPNDEFNKTNVSYIGCLECGNVLYHNFVSKSKTIKNDFKKYPVSVLVKKYERLIDRVNVMDKEGLDDKLFLWGTFAIVKNETLF